LRTYAPAASLGLSLALALALLASPARVLAHEGDPHVCGDGVREAEEECDDGNQDDGDTCHNDCTLNCSAEDYPSTFAAIQDIVFEGYQCNNAICHSAAVPPASNGGLNLEPAQAYLELLGAGGTGEPSEGTLLKRIEPSEPELSLLYLKLLKATDPARYAQIHPLDDIGQAMPNAGVPLTDAHLEAVRRWIRGGAPEDDVVDGTSELLGTCLPPPDPLKIPIPAPPPVDGEGDATGFQLRQTPWPLPANTGDEQGEDEICMATYYDLTATDLIPDWAKVPCPEFFQHRKRCSNSSETAPVYCSEDAECGGAPATCVPFRNTTNPTSECILWHKQVLYQDPQSHHSIVHVYAGGSDTSDPGWGAWTYKLEPGDPDYATKHGQPCDPTDVDPALGYNPGCSGSVVSSVACIGYGPDDNSQFSFAGGGGNFPQISGSQEPFYSQEFDDGVFAILPAAGIVGWNSHAFNLTETPSTMAQYLNFEYARPEDQEHLVRTIFQADSIFAQEVPPFETREVCATQTLPQGSRLFQLSSHTHVRGVQWRTWGPPNTPCQPKCPGHPGNTTCVFGGAFCGCEEYGYCSNDGEYCEVDEHCTGGTCELLPFCDELGYPREDAPLYFSTDYSDPLQLDIRPAMQLDGPDVTDRTLLFCSVYDNGSTDLSPDVKRWSQSPYPPDITINFTGFPITVPGSQLEPALGGPCPYTKLQCLEGPHKGEICGIYDNPDGFCGAPGLCDACPVHGGVTTNDEMFILLGNYYLVPEPAGGLLGVLGLGTAALLARRARRG
jgi:cysteine-rich repeat protein